MDQITNHPTCTEDRPTERSTQSVAPAPNPIEQTQISSGSVKPSQFQSAIVGSVVASTDGNTIRVTIVEQIGVVPGAQPIPQVISTPANNYPAGQYQGGPGPVAPQVGNQQPNPINYLQSFANTITVQTANLPNQPSYLPNQPANSQSPQVRQTNHQSDQQNNQTQPPPNSAQQSHHQNSHKIQDSQKDTSLAQASIPSTTLTNQVQNVLASLLNSSPVSQSPVPTGIIQQPATQLANEGSKQVTVTQEQIRDSAGTKTTEKRSEITIQPNKESSLAQAIQPRETIKTEVSVRVIAESIGQPNYNSSPSTLGQRRDGNPTEAPNVPLTSNPPEISTNVVKVPTQVLPNLVPNNLDLTPQVILAQRLPSETPTQATQRSSDTQTMQHRQHQEESRSSTERARDIQTVIIAEREIARSFQPAPALAPSSNLSNYQQPPRASLERTRENIIEKLSSIQSRIESPPQEIRKQHEMRGDIDNRVQGRDILRRPADSAPSESRAPLTTKLAERITNENKISVNKDDRPTNIIDLLKRVSQSSTNFKLLGKMDTSLEKACLTIITGTALGVVGVRLIYKALNLALLQTLGFLRDDEQSSKELGLISEQKELLKQLEEAATVEINSVGEQGFVVDLAGIVINSQDGSPINDVTVRSSEFGSCQTDTEGRFIFTNIPLGTPYTITVSSDNLKIKPVVIQGICGELEFLRINVVIV